MQYFMRQRLWLLGLILGGVMLLLTLLAAPTHNVRNYGSTYGRIPQDYGAWYTYMQERGTPIQRLQKPLELLDNDEYPITLLRIFPQLIWQQTIKSSLQKWIEKGNNLVVLGVSEIATSAPFSSFVESKIGQIKIETSRRKPKGQDGETLLSDAFGAIIWTEQLGKGKIVYSTTPYLAANAYQDYPNNYKFLSELVTEVGKTVWVDEYIHGHRDREIIQEEIGGTIWSYLSKTPLLSLFIQGIILIGLAIWAGNHRLGRAVPLSSPTIDNSEAYIQGLASVLQKASCSEFVVSAISQAEKQEVQKLLGLNDTPLSERELIEIVGCKEGMTEDLKSLLLTSSKSRSMKDKELLIWLAKWRKIKTQLSK